MNCQAVSFAVIFNLDVSNTILLSLEGMVFDILMKNGVSALYSLIDAHLTSEMSI